MSVVNKFHKVIKIGINYISPIVLLIYVITTFINLSLFSTELGTDAIRYRIATYSSIGITVLITLLYIVSRVYPKVSFKRKATVFIISLLMLIDGFIWVNLSLIEFSLQDFGSFSVDFSLLFTGIVILLLINVVVKGLVILVH